MPGPGLTSMELQQTPDVFRSWPTILLETHVLSSYTLATMAKFAPKFYGPFPVLQVKSQ